MIAPVSRGDDRREVDPASQALDRLEIAGLELWPPLKREWAATIATVRQRLADQDTEIERLREERDAAWATQGRYFREALAAEAENRRLTEGLREKDEIIDCLLQRGYFDPFVPLAAFRKIVTKGAYSVTTADEERAWLAKIEARALLSASPSDGGGA